MIKEEREGICMSIETCRFARYREGMETESRGRNHGDETIAIVDIDSERMVTDVKVAVLG